jgi:hypothetical protein
MKEEDPGIMQRPLDEIKQEERDTKSEEHPS